MIDFFRSHPERECVYVPKWAKDKTLLRPYVMAKGPEKVQEMLDAFIRREYWEWAGREKEFNAQCIRSAPLSIQGFVGIADRLEGMLQWESKEVPFGTGNEG